MALALIIFSEGFGKNQKCTLDLVTLNSHCTRKASEQDWKPLQISINLLETAVIWIGNDVFNSKMHFLSVQKYQKTLPKVSCTYLITLQKFNIPISIDISRNYRDIDR